MVGVTDCVGVDVDVGVGLGGVVRDAVGVAVGGAVGVEVDDGVAVDVKLGSSVAEGTMLPPAIIKLFCMSRVPAPNAQGYCL